MSMVPSPRTKTRRRCGILLLVASMMLCAARVLLVSSTSRHQRNGGKRIASTIDTKTGSTTYQQSTNNSSSSITTTATLLRGNNANADASNGRAHSTLRTSVESAAVPRLTTTTSTDNSSRDLPATPSSPVNNAAATTAAAASAAVASTPPTTSLRCSCWNERAPQECCKRTIFQTHKMGTILIQDLLRSLSRGRRRDPARPTLVHRTPNEQKWSKVIPQDTARILNTTKIRSNATEFFSSEQRMRSRMVVVMRNIVESIVSGYLYHKAGRECWLDLNGNERKNWTYSQQEGDLETVMSRSSSSSRSRSLLTGTEPSQQDEEEQRQTAAAATIPYKAIGGRNLCTYLAEESEEDGMRFYVEYAMIKWYQPLYEFFRENQRQRQQQQNNKRVLFVCYERLTHRNAQTSARALQSVHDWLFPSTTSSGGGRTQVFSADRLPGPLEKATKGYSGAHASDSDPDLRFRLGQMVRSLDRQLFHGFIAQADMQIQCHR